MDVKASASYTANCLVSIENELRKTTKTRETENISDSHDA